MKNGLKINCMQSNQAKFQAIVVGKKTFHRKLQFKIVPPNALCKVKLQETDIGLHYQLRFEINIKYICHKATQQLKVMKRLSKYLSRLNELIMFHTFFLSNQIFFAPCPGKPKSLEQIKERDLKFIYEDYHRRYEQHC